METKWVKIDRCNNSSWWYYGCEGMVINVCRRPHVSNAGNIVYSVVGTQNRTIAVEDVIDTKCQ